MKIHINSNEGNFAILLVVQSGVGYKLKKTMSNKKLLLEILSKIEKKYIPYTFVDDLGLTAMTHMGVAEDTYVRRASPYEEKTIEFVKELIKSYIKL